MLSGLDGILLCRKTECVIAHGVKDIEALQPLVTGKDIAGDIAKGMTHMKARTAGVREHIKHIVLGFIGRYFCPVGLLKSPSLLPFLLYFLKIIVHPILKFFRLFQIYLYPSEA